ncbi:MAG TPA: ABC transporter ATP-binding protein [Bryobacteraceae bacterium]|nr:ABC transporter ATP-binding protein [Bryobacteraceae bacterium]
MTPLYRLDHAGFSYGAARVLSEVTIEMPAGCLVALTGPNGAGKSTLLGIMAGLRHPYEGKCLFRGKEVRDWKRDAFARSVSFVPQSLRLEFPFTAEQVVFMGRTPYAGGLFETTADIEAARKAMEMTDVAPFAHRDFRSLSGGERQRVVLASALAQQPEVLLLDEPTTFLDLEHQLSTYRLLRRLAGEGLLVVAVTHDLNLAASYSDRVIALKRGLA